MNIITEITKPPQKCIECGEFIHRDQIRCTLHSKLCCAERSLENEYDKDKPSLVKLANLEEEIDFLNSALAKIQSF